MTTAAITIKDFKLTAPLLPATTTILLKGVHGIGKSSLAKQLASTIRKSCPDLGKFPVVDRRLSQQQAGDLLGLPSIEGKVTSWNPPDWYVMACTQPCFLMLDELNRATQEVQQGAMQIVLDRELNGHKLHPLTRVMTAINGSAIYSVNEMDPALLDRFWCVELNATVDDFLFWASSVPDEDDEEHFGLKTNIHLDVIDFIKCDDKWLDPMPNFDPREKQPSRRSWDKLNQTLVRSNLIDDCNSQLFFNVCGGFVGQEATLAFIGFLKNSASRITGRQILNEYENVKDKLNQLGQERLNVAIEKVSDYISNHLDCLTDEQSNNLHKFCDSLPAELKLIFWNNLTAKGTEGNLTLLQDIHNCLVNLILGVYGVDPVQGKKKRKFEQEKNEESPEEKFSNAV